MIGGRYYFLEKQRIGEVLHKTDLTVKDVEESRNRLKQLVDDFKQVDAGEMTAFAQMREHGWVKIENRGGR